jgi:hypothetical protein
MKKFLVITLILTIIFPAYCFASPSEVFPTEKEIVKEILLIIEDGIAEQEEIFSFLETMNLYDEDCLRLYSRIGLTIIGLSLLDFSGSSLEILLDLTLFGLGIAFIYLCIIILAEFSCKPFN